MPPPAVPPSRSAFVPGLLRRLGRHRSPCPEPPCPKLKPPQFPELSGQPREPCSQLGPAGGQSSASARLWGFPQTEPVGRSVSKQHPHSRSEARPQPATSLGARGLGLLASPRKAKEGVWGGPRTLGPVHAGEQIQAGHDPPRPRHSTTVLPPPKGPLSTAQGVTAIYPPRTHGTRAGGPRAHRECEPAAGAVPGPSVLPRTPAPAPGPDQKPGNGAFLPQGTTSG